MGPKFLNKHTKSAEQSFYCKLAEVPHTYDQFHYHKEYELLYVLENNGTRFMGDSILPFSNDDLVLVGPNLPHYWQSEPKYYENNPLLSAKLVLIQFETDFAGKDFFDLPEMKNVKKLLHAAHRGVKVKIKFAKKIKEKMIGITEKTGWNQMISLLDLLCNIGESDYELLASEGFSQSYYKSNNEEKISNIYNYLVQNHHRNLTLAEVAEHANMNASAFCRYFKSVTNKTLSESLNDIRIGIACRKLIDTELSIAEIGYLCGYQNVSYFNRQFKIVKNINPTAYRMKHLSKMYREPEVV
ncbi:AraC family transcriptional regulator [Pedobacter jamesrossensis]|uniref:AraC family transcriptional regulator n=1 Tax=Pedobacter jamesrossensis TaxID=1908238 RepID=A0ABV8NQX0_9SPHI